MSRVLTAACASLCIVFAALPAQAGVQIAGDYLESRTCDVYTGPCFANGEIGLNGHEAILAWSIDRGQHEGVDLSGLKVVMALKASDTLAFGGGLAANPDPIRSIVLVDERASTAQREALVSFARLRAGKVAGETVRVTALPITMTLDHVDAIATLKVGKVVEIKTRAMAKGDCVCTNESIFYPPLTKVENYLPAYNLENKFSASGLGSSWSNPNTRSAFLATFAY